MLWLKRQVFGPFLTEKQSYEPFGRFNSSVLQSSKWGPLPHEEPPSSFICFSETTLLYKAWAFFRTEALATFNGLGFQNRNE